MTCRKSPSSTANDISIAKPADVAPQPWGYRVKQAGEQQGEILITENVTLGPSQRVGESKRGDRNIIPITGGTLSGRIAGKVLMGGADYQILSPPATIDAHYSLADGRRRNHHRAQRGFVRCARTNVRSAR